MQSDIRVKKPYHIMNRSKRLHQVIHQFYGPIAQELFQFSIEEKDILRCLKDMRLLYGVLHDPWGIKFDLLRKVEPLPYEYTGTIIKRSYNDSDTTFDVLNVSHQEWLHPCDDTQIYYSSMLELFEEGKELAVVLVGMLEKYLVDECTSEELLEVIANRTYETGKKNTVKKKYTKSIYKKG